MRSARADTPASDGPTKFTPAVIEWHAEQPGGTLENSAAPSATGSSDTAVGGWAPMFAPGTAAPETRIGRGGQPFVSICDIQVRNAIRSETCASLKFWFGIRRRSFSSE